MFDKLKGKGITQKYGVRHLIPGNLRASKRSSRSLLVNLKTLKEIAQPLHVSFAKKTTEQEVLQTVKNAILEQRRQERVLKKQIFSDKKHGFSSELPSNGKGTET